MCIGEIRDCLFVFPLVIEFQRGAFAAAKVIVGCYRRLEDLCDQFVIAALIFYLKALVLWFSAVLDARLKV